MSEINDFLRGAIAMGHAVAGLFFLRFYWQTRDRFFVLFAAAFFLLGGTRVGMIFLADPMEQHFLYWLRFASYLLILGAILDKNLPRRASRVEGKQA